MSIIILVAIAALGIVIVSNLDTIHSLLIEINEKSDDCTE